MKSSDETRIEEGRRVIRLEAQTLLDLSERLDASFSRAVEIIRNCHGKTVISGMGKAGIIARKIAATLSSLGTSSFFMHPAEAAHGDLGMLKAEDVVILISHSGESSEITGIVPSIKSLGAPLIAMTGRRESFLAREADVTLWTGDITEACSLGLAPTSSTTAILALGDALAVTLMREKDDFSEKDFAFFHPGGALGKKLLRVNEVMRRESDCVIVGEDTSVKDVLFAVTRSRAGCAIVTGERGLMTGVFSDGDLRRNLEKNERVLGEKVGTVMTKNPKFIHEQAFALEALKMLRDHMIGDLPVLDAEHRPVGVISLKDLIAIGLV